MRIAVLGVGAIGGVIGGYLARAGREVTLIDRWEANIERIRSQGLTVTGQEEEFTVQAEALLLDEVSTYRQAFDAVILSVKSYDTTSSAKLIEPRLAPGGFIVSAQNGINEDAIAEVVGWPRVMGCVVTVGAGMYEPGHVLRTTVASRHSLTLGEPSGDITPRLEEMAEVLSVVGPTKTTTNLSGERWSKLATNCMSNAMSAFTGLSSSELRENAQTRKMAIRIGSEILRVTDALGLSLGLIWGVPADVLREAQEGGAKREEAERIMTEGAKTIGTGRPSLAQDMIKGRKTEVDFLNGYVLAKGRELGIPTPVNEAVVEVTKRLEGGELEPSVSNLGYMPH